ncbi:MarR family winged helix-turn-helix transcriptional regulator [Kineobactrum salinum]|uniref:MarR family transcriptional regulator n=1 Tax=Kineobactrum salinum TaxID=2708301 RepID=A0A6C0U3I0_9GAMM|nr:MarR family transcriptional regulator [Kineobactrum salinum]QIB64915.1 MarR family transcriptional regulator [Kineobactrum salinum]
MKPRKKPRAPRRSEPFNEPHNIQASHIDLEPIFEGQVDYLVRMIRILEIRAIDVLLEPMDLTLSAWYPLAVLRELDGMSQRELGIRLNLKDAAIGKAVDFLEKAGLVQRMTGKDRRKALVFLTDGGKKVAEDVAAKRQQLLEVITEGFSEREAKLFPKLLERCYMNINNFVESQKEQE